MKFPTSLLPLFVIRFLVARLARQDAAAGLERRTGVRVEEFLGKEPVDTSDGAYREPFEAKRAELKEHERALQQEPYEALYLAMGLIAYPTSAWAFVRAGLEMELTPTRLTIWSALVFGGVLTALLGMARAAVKIRQGRQHPSRDRYMGMGFMAGACVWALHQWTPTDPGHWVVALTFLLFMGGSLFMIEEQARQRMSFRSQRTKVRDAQRELRELERHQTRTVTEQKQRLDYERVAEALETTYDLEYDVALGKAKTMKPPPQKP